MRFKHVQLENGNFAVSAGRNKHFTRTETSVEQEAIENAIIISIRWHQEQAEKAWDVLRNMCPNDEHGEHVKLHGEDTFCSFADITCRV